MDIEAIIIFLEQYDEKLRMIFWLIMLCVVLEYWPTNIKDMNPSVPIIETQIMKEVEIHEAPEEIIEMVAPVKYGFTEEEIYLMTLLLCGSGKTDGDGEYDIDFHNMGNHEQVSLVLGIVMNRVESNNFPNTVAGVIWQKGQFSVMPKWTDNLPIVSVNSYEVVKAWCDMYDSQDPSLSIPENHLYFSGNGVINKSREAFGYQSFKDSGDGSKDKYI